MSIVSRGYTFGATEQVTASKLHQLVDDGQVSSIVNADISAGAGIVDTKLAQITTANKVHGSSIVGLASVDASAGVLPIANIATGTPTGSKYVRDDGTLHTVTSGVATDGTVNPSNLCVNGNFKYWHLGTALAPTYWAITGASATIAQEGTIKKLGSYSAKLTRSGTDCKLYQYFHAEKGITYWKGRTVAFGAWVYATVANRARIAFSLDGVTWTYSSYHTGDSTWQFLTVTGVVSLTASDVACALTIDTGDTSAYIDGAMVVEGASVFASESNFPDYIPPVEFTPNFTSGYSGYVSRYGRFTKIGQLVFVEYSINGNNNNANLTVDIPFVARTNSGSEAQYAGAVTYWNDNNTYGSVPGAIYVGSGASTARVYKNMQNLASTGTSWSASGTTLDIRFWMQYLAAE